MAQLTARESGLSRQQCVLVDDNGNLLGVIHRIEAQGQCQVDVQRQAQADPAMVGIDRLAVADERDILTPANPSTRVGIDDTGQVSDQVYRTNAVERECQAGAVIERYRRGGRIGMHLVRLRKIAVRLNRLGVGIDRNIGKNEAAVNVETQRVEFLANLPGEVRAYCGIRVVARRIDRLANFGERDDEGFGTGRQGQRHERKHRGPQEKRPESHDLPLVVLVRRDALCQASFFLGSYELGGYSSHSALSRSSRCKAGAAARPPLCVTADRSMAAVSAQQHYRHQQAQHEQGSCRAAAG